MPVLSYLVSPVPGAKKQLVDELNGIEFCETIISQNKDIVVLVTDTPDEESEKKLQEELKLMNKVQSISMVFGHVSD